jgi:hypothetical protein
MPAYDRPILPCFRLEWQSSYATHLAVVALQLLGKPPTKNATRSFRMKICPAFPKKPGFCDGKPSKNS